MNDPRQRDEFVPDWDVYRDGNGDPVTITEEQMNAIWHAVHVVERVRFHEAQAAGYTPQTVPTGSGYDSMWHGSPQANLWKSRLLGRMLLHGLPPTKTRPPVVMSGPTWDALPGGDPFA